MLQACSCAISSFSAPRNGEVCRLTSDYTAEMPTLLRDVEGEGLKIEQNCLLGAASSPIIELYIDSEA